MKQVSRKLVGFPLRTYQLVFFGLGVLAVFLNTFLFAVFVALYGLCGFYFHTGKRVNWGDGYKAEETWLHASIVLFFAGVVLGALIQFLR